MYADGGGLYLQVTEGGTSRVFRYWVPKRDPQTGDVIRWFSSCMPRETNLPAH
jgi:hypothetical protein